MNIQKKGGGLIIPMTDPIDVGNVGMKNDGMLGNDECLPPTEKKKRVLPKWILEAKNTKEKNKNPKKTKAQTEKIDSPKTDKAKKIATKKNREKI